MASLATLTLICGNALLATASRPQAGLLPSAGQDTSLAKVQEHAVAEVENPSVEDVLDMGAGIMHTASDVITATRDTAKLAALAGSERANHLGRTAASASSMVNNAMTGVGVAQKIAGFVGQGPFEETVPGRGWGPVARVGQEVSDFANKVSKVAVAAAVIPESLQAKDPLPSSEIAVDTKLATVGDKLDMAAGVAHTVSDVIAAGRGTARLVAGTGQLDQKAAAVARLVDTALTGLGVAQKVNGVVGKPPAIETVPGRGWGPVARVGQEVSDFAVKVGKVTAAAPVIAEVVGTLTHREQAEPRDET